MNTKDINPAILLHYLKGSISHSEQEELDKWLASDTENEKILLQVAALYHAQHSLDRIESRDVETAYQKTWEVINRNRQHKSVWRRPLWAAAAALLIVLSIPLIWKMTRSQQGDNQLYTLVSEPGKRSTEFTLPDGTSVFLNANSKLSYTAGFNEKDRQVSLLGEGYFKVAKQKDKPFTVSTFDNRMKVNVLGTTFNVQAYPEDYLVQTTLIEGSVNVMILKKEGENTQQQLHPSEKITFNAHSGQIQVKQVDPTDEIAWMKGRLAFKDTPLPEVVRHLSLFYGIQFQIQSDKLKHYTFTGTFENASLSVVLDYMKIASDIDYTIKKGPESQGEERSDTIVIMENNN